MAFYLFQAAYTPQAVAALAKNPEDREKPARALIERAGGKLHSFFYCVGEFDVMAIFEAPDLTTAMSIAVGVCAPGHLKASKTTPLLTTAEATNAFSKAGGLGYRGPSQ